MVLADCPRLGLQPGDSSGSVNFDSDETNKKCLKKVSVLVVDDEADLREAMAFDFRRRGFTVFEADSGRGAVNLLEICNVEIVISDIRMPNGDGIFLLEEIRKSGRDIIVIFVTGFTDYSEAECLQRGAYKVIAKPFDRKILMHTVVEALSKLRT